MIKKIFKLFLQEDGKKTWACSNPWFSDKSVGSAYHLAKALFQRYRGYLCWWVLDGY